MNGETIAFKKPDIHASVEPIGLLDAHGEPVRKTGWMSRLDDKGRESITLNKSTLWFVGTGLVLLQVIFTWGGSFLGFIRENESQKQQLIRIEGEMRIQSERQASDAQNVKDGQARQELQIQKMSDQLLKQKEFIDRLGGAKAAGIVQ